MFKRLISHTYIMLQFNTIELNNWHSMNYVLNFIHFITSVSCRLGDVWFALVFSVSYINVLVIGATFLVIVWYILKFVTYSVNKKVYKFDTFFEHLKTEVL